MSKEMKDQHRETDNKILKFQHEMMGPSTWIAEEKPNLKKWRTSHVPKWVIQSL